MNPKLIKTSQAQYKPGEFSGANTAGFKPIGDFVLVLPDAAIEKTSGNIHLPENLTERQSKAAESGIIVAIGEGAFHWNYDRSREWTGNKPQVGQRVRFQRYSGQEHWGRDGKEYRLMTDNCIGGIDEA